jgi:hypothetical protein
VNAKRMPRWPLFLIAAPAAIAVWSGWVGLGQLCGFGVIHPLPGIWDAATINTAITLPIGVEAYGAYALGAWLTPGTSARARKFARRSAIGALALGMLGQVAYHLLAAVHATSAPWPVTMFVSCLPVIALALGTALAHLLREPGEDLPGNGEVAETVAAVPTASTTVPGAVAGSVPVDVAADVPQDGPERVPADVPEVEPVKPLRVPAGTVPPVRTTVPRTVASGRARGRAQAGRSKTPEKLFAAEIEAGELPSLRSIKDRCHVGTERARVVQAELATAMQGMAARAA